ncbi:unnamed protein product [Hermetia illucens]|uniref:Sas10 C-terminal domain-containing protein n=1 Tax=Hermetia illucens TaxID=343691 RepID=A0A7R8UVV6_HERIL|nr:something about silencing protein 10 [Hermetia illucens]CAD7087531.1 unnamed protein product [Hermetia illucens]
MADKIKFGYDEDYEPSDSEDDLDEEEKELIANVRKKRQVDDPKREVLRFEDETDSEEGDQDEDEDLLAASDIEEGDEYDGIPDEKAWGKKRSAYYHTDFVDQDYSTYTEKEEELAQQEEEEAKAIQQRLAKQLDEADFSLDIYSEPVSDQTYLDTSKTKLKTDFTQLSARQKQELFQKDSPEFAGLVQDFEKYAQESKTILSPILKYVQENGIKLPAFDFIQTRNNLILTYCTNIGFYLVLKAKRLSVKNHPIVKRLVQLRQLIIQLDDTFQNVVKPQLDELLEAINSGEEVTVESMTPRKPIEVKKKKHLGILKSESPKTAISADQESESDDSDYDSQDISQPNDQMDTSDEEMQQIEAEEAEMNGEGEGEEDDDDERRGITYQIAKNKGLTPHRKKENRNPRVKHRNKFRKALVRRKGAVRTVRKELTRYGGEMSGIKANVRKGIKFKS